MSVTKSGKTIVLFRKNNFDAFCAAFIYWWLFGKDSVRATDTITHEGPTISFRAVDVFEDSKPADHSFAPWAPKINGYIGNGDTVISIGMNLPYVLAASSFFSYENDTTFKKTYDDHIVLRFNEMPEGCQYHYDQKKFLTELLLESLIEAKHLSTSDSDFILLNQFFRFFDGKNDGLRFDEEVCERVLTYLPQLRVQDFESLGLLIKDAIGFMKAQRKISPEDAVREHIVGSMQRARELSSLAQAYEQQTGIKLRLINSESADTARSQTVRFGQEASFVYRMVADGVRGTYYSSIDHRENALEVFPEGRPKIGNELEAEWLITMQDFYSLHFGQLQAPQS